MYKAFLMTADAPRIDFEFDADPETQVTTGGRIIIRRIDPNTWNSDEPTWLDPQVVHLPADVADALNVELLSMPEGWAGYR